MWYLFTTYLKEEIALNLYIILELIQNGKISLGIFNAVIYTIVLPVTTMCLLIQYRFSKDPYKLYETMHQRVVQSRIDFNIWIRKERQ